MASDGSLIFDTKVDTKGIDKGLGEIQQKASGFTIGKGIMSNLAADAIKAAGGALVDAAQAGMEFEAVAAERARLIQSGEGDKLDLAKRYDYLSEQIPKAREELKKHEAVMNDMNSQLETNGKLAGLDAESIGVLQGAMMESVRTGQDFISVEEETNAKLTFSASGVSGSVQIDGNAGGTTNSSDVFIAGEEGPELIVGKKGSTVFPFSETAKIVQAVNSLAPPAMPSASALYSSLLSPAAIPSRYSDTRFGYAVIPRDVTGGFGVRSPRDYASYLAELAAGCVQMITEPDSPDRCILFLSPYGYKPADPCTEAFRSIWENPVRIPYDTIELEGCEIADYELYIQKECIKTFNGIVWANGGSIAKYQGNITLDFTDNPFIDGRYYHKQDSAYPYGVLIGVGEQLGCVRKRPFSLKCHPVFTELAQLPKLGQAILIEEKPGVWTESFITKMVWKFRGGWEFGSAGADSRVLSQAAKRSLASHAEEKAKAYASKQIYLALR